MRGSLNALHGDPLARWPFACASEISIVFSAILMPIGDHDAISGNAGQSAKQFEWKLMDSYDATKGRGVPTC